MLHCLSSSPTSPLSGVRSELEECLSGAAAHSDAGHQEGPGAELCKGGQPVTVLSLPQLLHRSLVNEDPGIVVSPQDRRLASVFISMNLFFGFLKYLMIATILPS